MNEGLHEEQQPIRISVLWNAAALCFCGLSIGWIIGLSVTPIIEKVVEAVLGIAATVTATLAGVSVSTKGTESGTDGVSAVQGSEQGGGVRFHVSAMPIAALSLFLAIGASLGLLARTHDWFSPNPQRFADRWHTETGVDRKVLARVLLSSLYPEAVKEELRDKIGTMALADNKEVQKVALTNVLNYAYPQGGTASATDLHPGGNTGLKDAKEIVRACKAIADYKTTSPEEFGVVNVASRYFNNDLSHCPPEDAAKKTCAAEILKEKCG